MNRFTNEQLNVMQTAPLIFGERSQEMVLFEEMAELQNAICKFHRGRASKDDITTEIADVLIMLQQLEFMLNVDSTEEVERKLNRLKDRMEVWE